MYLIKDKNPILASKIKDIISNPYYTIETLYKKKLLNKIFLSTDDNKAPSLRTNIKLSTTQKKVFNKILPSIKKSSNTNFLIHGVPGSGKTEIYVKLAQEAISIGKNVMVLIPEIILTTQMKDRFIKYFGSDIAMWHSKMTVREKKQTIKKILSGDYKIIIGARSSIFCPLTNIGLIIIDEEQDGSYKQESPQPYYNARDIGLIRAKHATCPVVLTSATPSIETYYNTVIGKTQYIELNERYFKSKEPIIKIIDMIKFVDCNDEKKIISSELMEEIQQTLNNKKQIILLNNRRGYASSVFSKENKNPILCDYCNVPMSFHKSYNQLICHYCDSHKLFSELGDNQSNNIILNGYGTEKIHELLIDKFPQSSIARVDSDSLKNRKNLSSILNNFASGKLDIMIGTQMISKGLDFDNVQLVGVINADYGMFIPDFRSGEKVFQIISQVIGRSGRREDQGIAIIQTYNPSDPNLLNAITSNSRTFYASNLAERNELMYPPFSRLCRLIFSGENIEKVNQVANKITNLFSGNKYFKVLGPTEAPISKIKNKWRVNSLIAAKKDDPLQIQNFFYNKIGTDTLEKRYKHVNIKLDIDPLNML
jgi:primosomal protein N' (replication factor Y)